MRHWLLLLTLLCARPAAAHLTRGQRLEIRACRQDCRTTVLTPTTTTTVTCPTTSSTTTTTTLPGLDTPCGVLRPLDQPVGLWFTGTLSCAAGIDTFEGYWPLAPPPASVAVRGGCTGATATFLDRPSTLTLTCPRCCPAGIAITR